MGLFRRLIDPEGLAAAIGGEIEEVIDNLNHILNTKKDYGAPLGNLGMDDLNAYSSKDHIAARIVEEIRDNVIAFEPRLEVIGIEPLDNDNPLLLSFRLHCRLRNRREDVEVVFDSRNKRFALDRAGKE